MRYLRIFALGVAASLLLAACSSAGGSSQEPGGGGQSAAASTEASAEPSSNGGDGGSFDKGKAHFELTGAATKSGDLGLIADFGTVFLPAGPNSAILTYADASNSASLMINTSSGGTVVTYADAEIGVTLLPLSNGTIGECTVAFDDIDADSAKGTFRCENIAVIKGGETILGGGTLSGSFDARQ